MIFIIIIKLNWFVGVFDEYVLMSCLFTILDFVGCFVFVWWLNGCFGCV